ncbi:MAG: two pore domain potassium channel family protein [Bdellovibrionales bacterium]|nr:two pore domain potassium channel family protein [Bdellovibrionales bacterium]
MRTRVVRLFRQPVFWLITALGNGFVVAGAAGFHLSENGKNPAIGSFLDSFYWAVSTVTSVGYGAVSPLTAGGKIIGILLMMVGTLFMWSYMALFVGAIVSPDLEQLEREVEELESDLSEFQSITKKRSDRYGG